MRKKVLMAVANYYTSPFQVGSHHYARAFEKLGYEVLFISNPISPLHELFGDPYTFSERKEIYRKKGEEIGSISYYVPYTLLPPHNKLFLKSKFVMENWYKLTIPNILTYIKEKNFCTVDILWFDSALFYFLLDSIKYKKSILRLADYLGGFDDIPQIQMKKEMEIADKVDKIIYTARNLVEKYKLVNRRWKIQYVPNGVDYTFFESAVRTPPLELESIPRPRIVYVGAIREWFDENLLYYSAVKLPNYSFVIIGPEQRDLSKIKKLQNVYLLGKQPYNKLPQFLYNSDVGIIPFDVKNCADLVHSIHPLKLYEYMACGLPVVSVEWEELRQINSPAFLAKTPEEFVRLIEKALKVRDREKDKYIAFAKANDWTERVKLIIE